jgi:hypothetical protein
MESMTGLQNLFSGKNEKRTSAIITLYVAAGMIFCENMEKEMKRTILAVLAVLAVTLVAVSCGGNINKVKNGVFSDYDNTITIGKALENNDTLKGGTWKAVKKDGRDFVTYTVKFTQRQIEEFLQETIRGYEDKPNHGAATKFFSQVLKTWYNYRADKTLPQITSMSPEEINQVYEIFIAAFDQYNDTLRKHYDSNPKIENFFNPFNDWTGTILKDEYYGPYFIAHKDNLTRELDWPSEERYRMIVIDTTGYLRVSSDSIQNGMLTGDGLERYDRYFGQFGQSGNIELQKEVAATILRLNSEYESAQARLKAAKDEYDQIQLSDLDPMFTIDDYEIILSFVMNQDGTFTTNMIECWTELTLNCFDNLKVRFLAERSSNDSNILNLIYEGHDFLPRLFLP